MEASAVVHQLCFNMAKQASWTGPLGVHHRHLTACCSNCGKLPFNLICNFARTLQAISEATIGFFNSHGCVCSRRPDWWPISMTMTQCPMQARPSESFPTESQGRKVFDDSLQFPVCSVTFLRAIGCCYALLQHVGLRRLVTTSVHNSWMPRQLSTASSAYKLNLRRPQVCLLSLAVLQVGGIAEHIIWQLIFVTCMSGQQHGLM